MSPTPDILETNFQKVKSDFPAIFRKPMANQPKPPDPQALRDAREAAGLSLDEAGLLLGVTGRTVFNYESKGAPPEKGRAALHAYEEHRAGRLPLPEIGPRSVSGNADGDEPRFSFAQVMRTPAVRARLAALRTELIELGADEEREERIMATLRDRQRLNEFVGGRAEDLYTEREVLQVIDNYARIARDVMGTLG